MLTPRILVAVMGCHAREEQTDLQRRTWLNGSHDNVVVRIFRGRPINGVSAKSHGDELWVNAPDDYAGMCEKARLVYQHAWLNSFDFCLTTGDDTWVHIPRLVSYCQSIFADGKPAYHYVGHLRGEDNQYGDDYASGGPGTLLSQHALRILNNAPWTEDPAEDRWAGNILRAAGILLHCDRRFCLPAEWRDRKPWEIITVETMRVHRGALASMMDIHHECYDAEVIA